MSKRDEYIAKMKQQLDELNAQIGELEAKTQAGQEGLKKEYEEQLAKLRAHSQSAMMKLNELKGAGEEKWDELIAEGEKVHKAFVHSVNYFKSQLK
jgi:TolA-binding protein